MRWPAAHGGNGVVDSRRGLCVPIMLRTAPSRARARFNDQPLTLGEEHLCRGTGLYLCDPGRHSGSGGYAAGSARRRSMILRTVRGRRTAKPDATKRPGEGIQQAEERGACGFGVARSRASLGAARRRTGCMSDTPVPRSSRSSPARLSSIRQQTWR